MTSRPPGWEHEGLQNPVTYWLARIKVERQRQVFEEGWTPEHDQQHSHGELANAAAAYATTNDQLAHEFLAPFPIKRAGKDRVRQLVIAGALIVAELERLARAGGNAIT